MTNLNPAIETIKPVKRSLWRWIRRIVLIFVVAVVILLVTGFGYEHIAEAVDARNFPPPGQLVDVGGYKLHLYCTGQGSPTVILEGGWGTWSQYWNKVQPAISSFTRVCSYDRAGLGWSEAASNDRQPPQVIKDLHTLLHNAGVQPPYVMVGHSLGGVYAIGYSAQYPDEVAGMVLVDPTVIFPQAQQRSYLSSQELSQLDALQQKLYGTNSGDNGSGFIAALRVIRTFGIGRLLTSQFLSLTDYAHLPADQQAAYMFTLNRDSFFSEGQAELVDLQTNLDSVNKQFSTFGSKPFIILSEDTLRAFYSDSLPQTPDLAQYTALQLKMLVASHEALAHYSTIGKNIVVQNSGHYIQLDQPTAVIDAVKEVVSPVHP